MTLTSKIISGILSFVMMFSPFGFAGEKSEGENETGGVKQVTVAQSGGDFATLEEDAPLSRASADGRGFAASKGVANAVVNAIKRIDPDKEVLVESADGLQNCKKMLQLAKAGKYNGYLLEGMACPGGCIAGAGTIQPIKKSSAAVNSMMQEATFKECSDTVYKERLKALEQLDL